MPTVPSTFQTEFPETGWTREKKTTRPETVPTCPALPTYNYTQAYQKVSYLSYPGPLYLKNDKRTGTPTHSLHGSHTYTRAQPNLERTSRDASDTQVSHIHSHSNLRTIFLKSTDEATSDHCVKIMTKMLLDYLLNCIYFSFNFTHKIFITQLNIN